MRINKFLASAGIASRRKIDEMIGEGKVRINNKVAKLGDQIDSSKDKIFVNNREIGNRGEEKIYIILNKPVGHTSTTAKIKGEKNILELIESDSRLFPVGRLDKDSSGLILLTNDGELTQKLIHPKFHAPKTYEVKVLGNISNKQIEQLRSGIKLDEGITKEAKVKIKSQSLPHHSILEITLFEGKKRQIRRMLSELHLHILELKRISFGSMQLGELRLGKYRNLTKDEVELLTQTSK